MTHPTRAFSGSIINRFTGSKILASVGQISVAFPTYTGRLSIEFTNWEPEWTDHLFIIISPIEHEDKIIKQIKVNSHSVNNIELNPGNYIILIKADNNDFTPHIIKHVQIQVGETEVIKI